MYTLTNFQRYQALQSIPVLTDQRASELMDKMLVVLPEDEKAGFFFQGLFMDHLPADIRSHLMIEWITDPRWMVTRADKLLTVCGRDNMVQSLSSQVFEDISLVSHNPRTRWSSCCFRPHFCSSKTGWVPPNSSWILELLCQFSLTCLILFKLQVQGSNWKLLTV